jgi:peptidyl-prolyl cis-trans isomerase SurA
VSLEPCRFPSAADRATNPVLAVSIRRILPWFTLLATLAAPAHATLVERIVAVVGEKAILFSDLRSRARPFLIQVHQTVPEGAQRSAAISQLYRNVLDKLVDEAAYRDELRRQLLEAKLINVRLQGRIRVGDQDLRDAYRRMVLEERQRLNVTPAWIVVSAGSTVAEQRGRRALAESIAEKARTTDFAELARQYSDDPATRKTGGALPRVSLQQLSPTMARVAMSLEVGQTSTPVRDGDRYIILKIVARDASTLPDFDDARQELAERVYMEKMSQAKKLWLDGLKHQHHVEVRL